MRIRLNKGFFWVLAPALKCNYSFTLIFQLCDFALYFSQVFAILLLIFVYLPLF
jgi:hypothetical protein